MNPAHVHRDDPSDAVELAYLRIQRERMAGVPIVNPALRVEAVDFQRWRGHWLGIVVTPWCMSVLLMPASDKDWIAASGNQRRFVKFPYGELAFLGSHEPEVGEFQSCALFSPMEKFSTQAQALSTARASIIALLAPPAIPVRTDPTSVRAEPVLRQAQDDRNGGPSTGNASRRRFLGLRTAPGENTGA